jgi:hypothetical protein
MKMNGILYRYDRIALMPGSDGIVRRRAVRRYFT